MRTLDLLLKKFDEYGFEDFAVFADSVVVLFANSDQWDELPEPIRTEILELLERQLIQDGTQRNLSSSGKLFLD